ncbi:MAG: Crp/Fnr family transcriptional regulator [Saprospiraceae bacterium]|nr:Crp/Fnr family transcriptional regulator [Saprospiraceae bacterium]
MPLTTQALNYLSSFAELSTPYKQEVLKYGKEIHLEKGEIYFDKGTFSKKVAILLEGIMRIFDIDATGREWNKVILSPPSFVLGNANFQLKSVHYIDAITPCQLLEFPISFLERMLAKYPEAQIIQRDLLLNLYEKKSEREYDFLSLSAKERYLKFLQTHAHLVEQLPQFHIASYLGITSTQLSRINVALRNQQM